MARNNYGTRLKYSARESLNMRFPVFFKFSKHDIAMLERVGILKFSLHVPRIGGGVKNLQAIVFLSLRVRYAQRCRAG